MWFVPTNRLNHAYPQSDAQPGNIKSVLDALNGATKAAAESAGTETIVSPASTTTVTPQAPASTTGTFNDLAPSATPGSSSSSSSSLLGSLIKEQDAATIDSAIKPVQDQTSASILQQQQAASKTMAALAVAAGGAFCYPKTADEFHQAVENSACTIVALNRQVGDDDEWGIRCVARFCGYLTAFPLLHTCAHTHTTTAASTSSRSRSPSTALSSSSGTPSSCLIWTAIRTRASSMVGAALVGCDSNTAIRFRYRFLLIDL